ncbi:hypothetical protein B0H17DRAFT_1167813 [Mycena rosella]|uniref:Polyketide synthase phosphopantetheine-binding domain-containing protein n=1 Tax=Mycena rosella TaxID=1033263 RepID=A0AAD7DSV0_MYCRO|nr:hypothetical protein B0H17DRAFT_1167813 [Mycena rosella]
MIRCPIRLSLSFISSHRFTTMAIFPSATLTLPEVLDFRMEHTPDNPMYVYSVEGDAKTATISYLEFGRASHRVARALWPDNAASQRAVAIIGVANTILYQAIVMGMMVAGAVPFPISPRNSPAAVVNLLLSSSCHHAITTKSTAHDLLSKVADELVKNHPDFSLMVEEMPSLQTIYPKLGKERHQDPFMRYFPIQPYSPLDRASIIFHSSGSTGFPKIVKHTYLSLIHWAQFRKLSFFILSGILPMTSNPAAGSELRAHDPPLRISSMGLPPFHTFGINSQLILPLYSGLCVSVYPPTADPASGALPMSPSPASILDHALRTDSNALLTIPAMLQIWAHSPAALAHLQTMALIIYSGGFMPPRLGRVLKAAGVRFRPAYGGTEFGNPTLVKLREGDEEEWAWMEFSDRAHVRWVPQGDGTYECQFLTTDTHSLPVENLLNVRGYATADLWVRHPSKDYLWKLVGRIDDVIVHSSGEKTIPAPMEDVIITSPYIKGVVIFGERHSQPGVLVELVEDLVFESDDEIRVTAWRNKIWWVFLLEPTIEEANEDAPSFSKIYKEMVLFCKPSRPLPRSAGKGNVVRKAALAAYETEIEQLYETVESTTKGENTTPPNSWESPYVLRWLLVQAEDLNSAASISPTRDLFEQGFDSLSATILRRRIAAAFRLSKNYTGSVFEHISHDIVYRHPILANLANVLVKLAADSEHREEFSQIERIAAMVEHYTSPGWNSTNKSESSGRIVVLLTGSTGNLGADILARLVMHDQVELVYAFNRPSRKDESLISRHHKRFEQKGLDHGLLDSGKVLFLEGDTVEDQFGLDNLAYNKILNTVTTVIHAAWRLDFNLSLQSFESNIHGTRNLIEMAQTSRHASSLRFLFTSSLSSVQGWNPARGLVPEELIRDPSVAVGTGYGESKFVAEQLLSSSGLHACSLRINQMSGGSNGVWPITDWFPILVQASLKLGTLPDARGVIAWIPVDTVAKSILQIALSGKSLPPVLNISHPHPIQWSSMIATVRSALIRAKRLEPDALALVPFQRWFKLLENSTDSDLPALKLLNFFQRMSQIEDDGAISDSDFNHMISFDTTKAVDVSSALGTLSYLAPQEIERWVEGWIIYF